MTSLAKQRYAARLAAVQALYQREMAGGDTQALIAEFVKHRLDQNGGAADPDYFRAIVVGVETSGATVDPMIEDCLSDGWSLDRLGATLRSILRAAGFELSARHDVPAPVIIDEYVNLAARFTGVGEVGFVNGVLDRLARRLRGTGAETNGRAEAPSG